MKQIIDNLLNDSKKWDILSPYLKLHGSEALSYSTLQNGLHYFFVENVGYIAYIQVNHFILSRKGSIIALTDPVCAKDDYALLTEQFVQHFQNHSILFSVVSERYAALLRTLNFKVNCVGYEPYLPIQEYNTRGDWNHFDLIRRAVNEVKRKNIRLKEVTHIEQSDVVQLQRLANLWLNGKIINDHEIWFFTRKPIYQDEPDVRKFVAYDADNRVIGFAFYDPIYLNNQITGYSAVINRSDEKSYHRLTTALNMYAAEQFKKEGKNVLNLCLAPFDKINKGVYNDDKTVKFFFDLSRKYGEKIYNFSGLSFVKSKYHANEEFKYLASNRSLSLNDIYLAYYASNMVSGYFSMFIKLVFNIVRQGSAAKNTKVAKHK